MAHSVLCHVVVSKWCKETGYASGSKERSERCARLSASVARKTVELLNEYHEGRFVPVKVKGFQKTKMDCMECHSKTK